MKRPSNIVLAASALVAIIIVSMLLGVSDYFLNIEGLVIVIGGSAVNAFLSYDKEDVKSAFLTIKNMLKEVPSSREKLHKDIRQLMLWSYIVKTSDFMELEKQIGNNIDDPIMRYGVNLVLTDYTSNHIREMITTVAEAEFERRCTPVTVLRNMAATAPAFGMVGTLIGMVMLLRNVGADINNIGSGLAIAMLSTLYGILIARLVCLPAADKLLQKEERELFRHEMLAEGFAMLVEKRSPFYMQDKLNSFLEPSKHFDFDNYQQLAMQHIFRSPRAA